MMRAGGTNSLQLRRDLPDRVHAVVDEVDLPAALEFLLDRRLDQLVVPTRDHRLDRHAVFRRRLDHAHVAQSHQRHVQGPRDGRRRHGQHVDLLAHLLEALFMTDAEALFFVYNQQS